MNYSKGITWFDDCRIPFVDEGDKDSSIGGMGSLFNNKEVGKGEKIIPHSQGRFPPNLLCSDDMLNDGSINGVDKTISITNKKNDLINWGFNNTTDRKVKCDKGTNSRYYDIDKWFEKMINEL